VEALKGNSSWKAYPNPSSKGNYIHLELLDNQSIKNSQITVKISDMVGTEISSATFSTPKQVEEFVNQHLQSKNPGLYVLNLGWNNQTEISKLFIR
jgi:hypothetical protein